MDKNDKKSILTIQTAAVGIGNDEYTSVRANSEFINLGVSPEGKTEGIEVLQSMRMEKVPDYSDLPDQSHKPIPVESCKESSQFPSTMAKQSNLTSPFMKLSSNKIFSYPQPAKDPIEKSQESPHNFRNYFNVLLNVVSARKENENE